MSVIEDLLREQVPGKTFAVLHLWVHCKVGTRESTDHVVNSLRQALSTSMTPNLSNTTFDLVPSK